MRRPALLGLSLFLPVLLSACSGVGTYLGDTFTWTGDNPNVPLGDSETVRRSRGEPVAVQPVLTEPGDIWPGPPPPTPTLADVERNLNLNPNVPPSQTAPDLPDHQQPRPGGAPAMPVLPGVPMVNTPPPVNSTVNTPRGPATITGGTPGYNTTTIPGSGGQGILIPNGNGTSTLIGPNGSVTTVPTR